VELGVSSAERVGYYSGWLEAGAALSMMVALYPASRLADRIGRRPILITGVLVASFCGGSFGFGQSYPALLFIRAMNGVFNAGQGAVARGMFMELSDPSNRSQIFAFVGRLRALPPADTGPGRHGVADRHDACAAYRGSLCAARQTLAVRLPVLNF
jgi:MFS family permease